MNDLFSEVSATEQSAQKKVNYIPSKENVEYNKVYEFNDVSVIRKFVFDERNRDLSQKSNERHWKEIQRSIEKGKAQYLPPILVDINTLTIVDGQNRTKAIMEAIMNGKDATLKVIFNNVKNDKELIDTIKSMNSNNGVKTWSINDHIHCSITSGNESLLKIMDFAREHKIGPKGDMGNISVIQCLIFGKRVVNEINNNTLVVTDEQIEKAENLYKKMELIINALGFTVLNFQLGEGLAGALYQIYNDDELVKKMKIIGFEKFLKYISKNPIVGVRGKNDWFNRLFAAMCAVEYDFNKKKSKKIA